MSLEGTTGGPAAVFTVDSEQHVAVAVPSEGGVETVELRFESGE